MKHSPVTPLLRTSIEEAFRTRAWHGTNLKGSLRGITAREASWRPGRGRHNIWEIALHCAYWKYAVRRRLLGERRGSFPRKGHNWFPMPEEASAQAWRRDLTLLDEAHRLLVAAVAAAPRHVVERTPARGRFSNRSMLAGIAMHDIYHAGQIQLLKRLMRR
jgi:uncharacterized damage-inducible protein DinB